MDGQDCDFVIVKTRSNSTASIKIVGCPVILFNSLDAYSSHLRKHRDFVDEVVQTIAEKDYDGLFEF